MVKLIKDTQRVYELGDINEFPVQGGQLIYQGAAIGLDPADGFAKGLEPGDIFLGFAEDHIDNSNGFDGQKRIRVKKRGSIILEVAGMDPTFIGKSVYATDDGSFTISDVGAAVYVGQISRLEYNENALVEFDVGNIAPTPPSPPTP